MLKISKVYFSPSNTTKRITEEIAKNFEGKEFIYDLLHIPDSFKGEEFSEDDLVIIGLPIFGGRIPNIAKEKLEKFKGNNTPTIAFINYGNRAYEDGLLELKETLEEKNFNVIGAGAFISQHSIFTDVAKDRPDEEDLKLIKEFTEGVIKKIENKDYSDFKVPGNKDYKEYSIFPFVLNCNESKCTFCYDCVTVCPLKAIPDEDPVGTDSKICNGCTACITICPENARSFTGEEFEAMNNKFVENNSTRKEGEYFL